MASNRKDVKNLAQQIETLAKELQTVAENGGDLMMVSNELSRNTQTLVFVLGEVYALEEAGANKTVTARVLKTGNRNYHNVRNSLGRFTKATNASLRVV